MTAPRVAIAPAGARQFLHDAVEAGGGTVVDVGDADALVWAIPTGAAELDEVLATHPALRWVQLPWAGIEPVVHVVRAHRDRVWTCGKGVYAEEVAEHALALALAGMRGLGTYARARSWLGQLGINLLAAPVTIVGGGGITESLLRLLGPFGCDITVVRRHPVPMAGAANVVPASELDDALARAQLAVLALALTPETEGLIDRRRLALLPPGAWLVNVARGKHVLTGDLVDALRDGQLGGAGLDVTEPEPLPDGHPLWDLPNVIITPHTANTFEMAMPVLARRVTENVRRWRAGEPLIGLVDADLGY